MIVLPVTNTIQNANNVIAIAQLLAQALQLAQQVAADNSILPMGTAWATLGTCVLGTDGSTVGMTVDGSPTAAHPVNPLLYPTLAAAMSPNQLNQLLSLALTVPTFAAGSLVAANGLTPALLVAVGGPG